MVDSAGQARAFPRQPDVPPWWLEKVACLMMAAHLEGAGYGRVLLSVPTSDLDDPLGAGGIDWATSVKAVQERGRCFQKGEGRARTAAYKRTCVSVEERAALRRDLRRILGELVAADAACRYDGIWHDYPARIDLVAWRGREVLAVEAKGVTGAPPATAVQEALRKLLRQRAEKDGLIAGLLLPQTPRFTAAVRTVLPAMLADGRAVRIYWMTEAGSVREESAS